MERHEEQKAGIRAGIEERRCIELMSHRVVVKLEFRPLCVSLEFLAKPAWPKLKLHRYLRTTLLIPDFGYLCWDVVEKLIQGKTNQVFPLRSSRWFKSNIWSPEIRYKKERKPIFLSHREMANHQGFIVLALLYGHHERITIYALGHRLLL